MKVEFITITPDAEKLIADCARVSNPNNQGNPEYEKLLSYCVRNKHWSIFEQASMTLEIETSRAISAQILRHASMCFQEFSQRYQKIVDFEIVEARRQDKKNRQNSIDDVSVEDQVWFYNAQLEVHALASKLYVEALSRDIAKECARFLLPLSTKTKLYMTGNIRSWIHYIQVRADSSTQLEHRLIAEEAKKILTEKCPTIGGLI